MHDMLAEFGLCCAHGSNDKEEGTFLKLAIKHLLALHMKLKSNFQTLNEAPEKLQVDQQPLPENNVKRSEQISDAMFLEEPKFQMLKAEVDRVDLDMACTEVKDDVGRTSLKNISNHNDPEKEENGVEYEKDVIGKPNGTPSDKEKEKANSQPINSEKYMTEDEKEELEIGIDNALDRCFYCLYGLNLRSDSSYEDDLAMNKNTSHGDYHTKEPAFSCSPHVFYIVQSYQSYFYT